jgi:mercuric ion transport protein
VLLSACCVLPFALVMLGLGGAWLANLHALYPYRWLFLTASGVVLWLAWRRLYRPAMVCADGTACAVPKARRFYRLLFWLLTALTTISAAAPYLLGTLLR